MLWHNAWHRSDTNWFFLSLLTSSGNTESSLYWSKHQHPGEVGQSPAREKPQSKRGDQARLSTYLPAMLLWEPKIFSFFTSRFRALQELNNVPGFFPPYFKTFITERMAVLVGKCTQPGWPLKVEALLRSHYCMKLRSIYTSHSSESLYL